MVLAPVAGAKLAEASIGPTGCATPFNPRGDGDKKELVTGESAKETVKTIAQGRPDGGFKRSSQHSLFSLMTAARQALPLAFSSPASFSVGH